MKVRILFYKYKWKWVNFAIQAWTWPWNMWTKSYSHCEVWVQDGNCGFEDIANNYLPQPNFYYGTCYTSTMRGDYNGTVKRPASEVLPHPDRWDYYEIEVADVFYWRMMAFMNDACQRNKGYDKPALLKFFLPFWRKSSPDKYICSEFVQEALFWGDVFSERYLWSPRRLSRKLEKLGYKFRDFS